MTEAFDRWDAGDPRSHEHPCNRRGCHTAWVDMLLHGQALLLLQGELIMADLTRLNDAVTANTEATNAAVAALGSAGSGTDQAAVDAAAQQIETNTAALNDAVNPPAPTP